MFYLCLTLANPIFQFSVELLTEKGVKWISWEWDVSIVIDMYGCNFFFKNSSFKPWIGGLLKGNQKRLLVSKWSLNICLLRINGVGCVIFFIQHHFDLRQQSYHVLSCCPRDRPNSKTVSFVSMKVTCTSYILKWAYVPYEIVNFECNVYETGQIMR